jgi:hypothetical protein
VRIASLVLLVACAAPIDAGDPDRQLDPDRSDAATTRFGERCGNAIDDDGDGRIDEDCAPSLFGGVYAPMVSKDPALAQLEAAAGRTLSVIQTYRTTSELGIQKTGPDLAAIYARGQVPHLNVELDYPRAQYASPTAEPLAHDLLAMGDAIARSLKHAPAGRLLLTFGAEMNGNWTSWGCLPVAQYVALYRAAHAAFTSKLDQHGVDRRRVRWVFGPDAKGSGECPTAAAYYPGHAYVDLVGLSAYRSGTASVEDTVLEPMQRLFDGANIPAELRRDRFVLLQTGSRAVTGRDAWITELWDRLAADDRAAGIIYFDAADWAIAKDGPGWSGLTGSLANAPLADRALEGTFAPHFWDVAYGDPGFGEIQALRDAGLTTGCGTAPPRFCPNDLLTRAAAVTLLGRGFDGDAEAALGAGDPVTETQLAAAITALGGVSPAATDLPATRARAAILIAHGARLELAPL